MSGATTAPGTFAVTMHPGSEELDGAVNRFELSKTFHGDLQGAGAGVMLPVGIRRPAQPATSRSRRSVAASANGKEASRCNSFGSMHGGTQTLHYAVVPGSGVAQLTGITGTLHLHIDEDGTHRSNLEYEL